MNSAGGIAPEAGSAGTAAPEAVQRLEHFPVTFFAVGMGMMGLTLALHATETAYGLPAAASRAALLVSLALLGLIAGFYIVKALRHPGAVAAEWHHPVKIAFFPAISISLLLLSAALLPDWPGIARLVWLAGMLLQGVLALAVIGSWIGHRAFLTGHLTPAWFIPAVGNVIVPIAGAKLGWIETSWLFFSGGLVFWIVLLTLVVNRLMFHDPLPSKMVPTLMILVAPPAVGFVAWTRLNGGAVDGFAHFLLSTAYVFAALVATQAGKMRRIPFALSWWALSFPIAALTLASFTHAAATGSEAHRMIGTGLIALLLAVIALLILRTGTAIRRGAVCVPE